MTKGDHSRRPGQPIKECAEKLAFFYRGQTGPTANPVICKYQFSFSSCKGMAQALGLGEAQLKGVSRDRLSDTALKTLGEGLGFNVLEPVVRQSTAVEFGEWYNDNNRYDGRFAKAVDGSEAHVASGLRCVRLPSQRPESNNRRLVTVELRSDRNESTLPWPLHLGLTLGTYETRHGKFFIWAARLVFHFGASNAKAAKLAGDRRRFPGNLLVAPSGAPIKVVPDGESFKPEWIIEATTKSRPAGPITLKDLIDIYDLAAGDVVEVQFWVAAKDLVAGDGDAACQQEPRGNIKTHAFVLKASVPIPPRDAKTALLEHVERMRLLKSDDGEACLAKDSLSFADDSIAPDQTVG